MKGNNDLPRLTIDLMANKWFQICLKKAVHARGIMPLQNTCLPAMAGSIRKVMNK